MDTETIRKEITTAAIEEQKEYQVLLQWLWENHNPIFWEWRVGRADNRILARTLAARMEAQE